MGVRLLVVVLTLIGVIPVRICTCGAHNPFDTLPASSQPADREPTSEATVTENSTSPEHHDDDCHFIKPRPLMPVGVALSIADAPPVDVMVVAHLELVAPPPQFGFVLREFRPPPNRPLFITLLVLRN